MKLVPLIFEFIFIFFALIYIVKAKMNITRIILYFLLIACPATLIYLGVGQWQSILFWIIGLCIYFLYLSKNPLSLIHIFLVIIIGILADNVTQYLMTAIQLNNNFSTILVQYLIFAILFAISIYIYNLLTKKVNVLFTQMKSAFLLVLFITFFTMSAFYINIYLTDYLSKDSLLTFNIVTQIIYFVITIYILYLTSKNIKKEVEFKKIQFETAQFSDYMQSLELINNDMQKFRHDYTNILFTMQGYMDSNDFEGLKSYFKKYIFSAEEDTLKKNKQIANLSKLHNTGIKGLLLTKTLQAEQKGISVNIEVPDTIETINMNLIDLARILGILLDNAIEAKSNNSSQHEISIAFFKDLSGSLIIIIENTVEENIIINIEKIFIEGFSTKGENRGNGLNIVKNVISNYPNTSLNTSLANGLFTQIIVIE